MNKAETQKFLALVKVAYPTAYKDMDKASLLATVNMWQATFMGTPYPIMEMAFDRFRCKSKFPPTVAEIFEELKDLYFCAIEDFNFAKLSKDKTLEEKCQYVMQQTERYRNGEKRAVNYNSINESAFFEAKEPKLLTGEE